MDFSSINKSASRSFQQQQKLIKDILMGKSRNCPECNQAITASEEGGLKLKCPCAHIDIALDSDKLS